MTDRLTDRQMDKVITIGPLPFLAGGALIVSELNLLLLLIWTSN